MMDGLNKNAKYGKKTDILLFVGSIYLFSLSRLSEKQLGYILIITALHNVRCCFLSVATLYKQCTVLLMVTPLRGDL